MAIQNIDIADKTTLDSVKTDTTALRGMGGIKYNSTTSKPQVYDTTNSTWVDLQIGGGGGNAQITIFNDNSAYTNKVFTVRHETNLFSDTATMTGASVSIQVPYLGKYYITWENASGQTLQQSVTVVGAGDIVFTPLTITEVSPFATASEAELLTVLEAHYYDKINLANYWSVGDTRKISLSSFAGPNPNSSETWAAQDITVTILGFDHTDLVTPINGHTKAAITLQTKELLSGTAAGTAGVIYVNGDSSYDMSFTKWSNLYMRTYLNDKVWGAFPTNFKSMIKPSKHYRHTNYNDTTSEIVTDNLFLPSYPEIFGTASYQYYTTTSPTEGYQFEYYTNNSNRIKYPNNNGAQGGSAQIWWQGSPSSRYASSSGYYWCGVTASGSADYFNGGYAYGLAPAFAM